MPLSRAAVLTEHFAFRNQDCLSSTLTHILSFFCCFFNSQSSLFNPIDAGCVELAACPKTRIKATRETKFQAAGQTIYARQLQDGSSAESAFPEAQGPQ